MNKENKSIGISNTKVRDSSGKMIFKDPILCAQFLRDYIDIPMLKNVQPEDIEDETDRFVHIFSEERNSDVVKRIRIQPDNEIPFYFISLIEHKSGVDYNVIMQVFRYMAFIWEDYEKEMNRKYPGISKTEGFKYPPILPIIFYDGTDNWTAVTSLHDRVMFSDILGEYIPDYQCIVMKLKDYTNAELIEKKNILSLVLLIDKMRDMEDFSEFLDNLQPEDLDEVTEKTPEYLLKLAAKIMEVFLAKLNVPEKEAAAFTEKIWERSMGELFLSLKESILAEQEEARKRGMQEGREEGQKKGREEGRKEGREEGRKEGRAEALNYAIDQTIHIMKVLDAEKEMAVEQLIEKFGIGRDDAARRVEANW